MEDETSEELTTDSEYSDSFVATDDDLEEELTWDSEDSRPAGPSPDSDPWEGPGPELRNRPIIRRRVIILPDSLSENSSQVSPVAVSATSSPVRVVRLQDTSQESDSDETYVSEVMAPPSHDIPVPQSPEYSPPPSPLAPMPQWPRSPDYPPPSNNPPRSPDYPPPSNNPPRSPDYPPPSNNPPRSPDYPPPSNNPPRSPDYPPLSNNPPRSPDYPPPSNNPLRSPRLEPAAEATGGMEEPHSPAIEPQVIEIQSSPPARLPNRAVQTLPTVTVSKPAVENQLDSSLSEGDDASLCTICMCPLTNSGTHRVVCLRCGHIFGQACVERWIKVGCNNGARRCPTCNKKACLKDIRVLYLPKVVPLDTSERDRLMLEKEQLAMQMQMLESNITRTRLQHSLVVAKYEDRIAALEKQLQEGRTNEGLSASLSQVAGLAVVTTATISHDGGCRVMAFNTLRQDLVVSQPSGNTVFAGFGVRVVNSVDWQPSRFVLLHAKAVRDLQFHAEDRDLLLSVSLDQNAKLFDLAANSTVHTFKGEGPLWSCCWDVSHPPHLLLLGSQSGKVIQYDRRMTDHYVNLWETDNNKTPVVALASTPGRAGTPFPQGGFLSCRLNTVFSYLRQGEKYSCQELAVEGPFMSMRYDGATQMMLTTSRPSSRSPHTRVCLSLLDCDSNGQVCAPLIHTFNCGSSARVMSRSTAVPHVDDSLVVAHNESGRTLDMWSSKRGDHMHSVPVREPVIDLAPLPLGINKPPLLAALSEKKLTLYRVN